jgi:hypothetical protein
MDAFKRSPGKTGDFFLQAGLVLNLHVKFPNSKLYLTHEQTITLNCFVT